jgi:hypothetical protein
MWLRKAAFFALCFLVWLVILPLCAVWGVIVLLGYAVISTAWEFIGNKSSEPVGASSARELASRVCFGT